MTSKHTPGEWIFNRDSNNQWTIETPNSDDEQGNSVIVEITEDRPLEEQIANAQLIASAPALLEACKTLVDSWNDAPEHFRNKYGNIIDSAVGMAREAIAKATKA